MVPAMECDEDGCIGDIECALKKTANSDVMSQYKTTPCSYLRVESPTPLLPCSPSVVSLVLSLVFRVSQSALSASRAHVQFQRRPDQERRAEGDDRVCLISH